jgi:hypothetical protein
MRSRFSLLYAATLMAAIFVIHLSESAQGQDIFVTPVPNAPFTGTIQVEREVIQRDGSTHKLATVREIGRDSRGRIFNQYRMLLPAGSTQTPVVTHVLLYDPETRTSATLYPQQKMFRSGVVNRPPETVPPALLNASPTGNSLPQNEFIKEEDLGSRQIEGVPVHGVRETQTISAQDSGIGKEMVIIDEYWYSADLRINLIVRHNDPRTGSVSMTVTHISRSEPDPSLLAIPDGFTPFRQQAKDTGTGSSR